MTQSIATPRLSTPVRWTLTSGIVFTLALFVLFFVAGSPAAPTPKGAEVHGFVSVRLEQQSQESSRQIRLPGAEVFLLDPSSGVEVTSGFSDPHGWYDLAETPAGTYELCARAPNFTQECRPGTITIAQETVHTPDDLLLSPRRDAFWGTVLAQDGKPCFRESSALDLFRTTRVELWDVALTTLVAGPVLANSQGQYVMPAVPGTGSYQLRSECDAASTTTPVTVNDLHVAHTLPVVQTLPNRSPQIDSLVASLSGQAVRRASAGDTLTVDVSATDPDGDPLHYRWNDGTGSLVSVDASSIQWTLENADSTNLLVVEVYDGKGGFDAERLTIKTTQKVAFIGRVTETGGSPGVANATVSVNGASTATDAAGSFRLEVGGSERYVLNVAKPGYAFLSNVYHTGKSALALELARGLSLTFDPTRTVTFGDERQALQVQIEGGSLVNPKGKIATGPLSVTSYAYNPGDPNGIPGDYSALDLGGNDVTLESYGAFGVEISDPGGTLYNLRPGATAQFALTVDPAQLPFAPPSIPLLRYDPATGYWIQKGQANLLGNQYVGQVTSFSQWNTDTTFSNAGCIRIVVDEDRTQYPFKLRVTIPTGSSTNKVKVFPVTEKLNGLFRLPPNESIKLEILPASGPSVVLKTYNNVNSGASVVDPFPPFPYTGCQGYDGTPGTTVVLALDQPVPTAMWLSRKGGVWDGTNPIPAATQIAEANEYYDAIGATGNTNPADDNDTLTKWKGHNGFPTGEVAAYYFNNADLGFGREMHCRQTGGTDMACYVTNYGGVGVSPEDAIADLVYDADLDGIPEGQNPVATVAMETDSTQGAKFYVYNAAGNLIPQATLDSEGPKAVPNICLVCHGGNYNSTTNQVTGASFREFDAFSFKYDAVTGFSLSNQQENLRRLNNFVKQTGPNASNPNDPIVDLIDGLYPTGVHVVGSTAHGDFHYNPVSPPYTNYYVPTDWATPGEEALYLNITRRYCRACHIGQSSFLDWTSYSQFSGFAGGIENAVCNTHDMPHAEVPLKNIWFSTNPHGPAYLADGTTGLGFTNPCTP